MKKLVVFFTVCLFLFFGTAALAEPQIEFSRSFLGAYKKTMRFYPQLKEYSDKYSVNCLLVLAIAMYESGGNNNLNSHAGAHGLMQVMPSTAEMMKAPEDIEAGVKYLRYLQNKLAKELKARDGYVSVPELNSFIVMAYNGGPGCIKRKSIAIETYQYLQGVSLYFNMLSQDLKGIERASVKMRAVELEKPTTWPELSAKLNISELELRLHNPFVAHRLPNKLPAGWSIAYPVDSAGLSFETVLSENGQQKYFYTVRRGDIMHHLANGFGFSYGEMRDKCGLLIWGALQPATRVEITFSKYLKK